MNVASRMRQLWQRFDALFTDREFFMRANGEVRFLTVPARLQRRVAYSVLAVIGIWISITLVMIANQFTLSIERMALVRKQETVASAEQRLSNYRDDIDKVAQEVEQRQDILDDLWNTHFGDEPLPKSIEGEKDEGVAKKVSAAMPEAAHLAQLEERQIAYAVSLTQMANKRAAMARSAIKSFGLNPKSLMADNSSAMGGPFIPALSGKRNTDPRFQNLANALDEMNLLENALAAIPSANPSIIPETSSSFGYRHDPFNGRGAMHAGIDFRGAYGSPILAAADGVISHAGWRGGYGNTIEITHANGLMTRYAHLSGIKVKLGDKVSRNEHIGAMGSTGRSTGTHLHFEVRINGKAVDPAKFLGRQTNVQ